jgi:hypothetical protein
MRVKGKGKAERLILVIAPDLDVDEFDEIEIVHPNGDTDTIEILEGGPTDEEAEEEEEADEKRSAKR